jgi:predicted metal-dependent HD superfamily phosphohydrolase
MWLYRHHTASDLIDLDHGTGQWRPVLESEKPAGAKMLADLPVVGSYEVEDGKHYFVYWSADGRFWFRTFDNKLFEICQKRADGSILMLDPGRHCTIEPARGEHGRGRQGMNHMQLVAGNGDVLHELVYNGEHYRRLLASDITAAASERDITDWDFFVAFQATFPLFRERMGSGHAMPALLTDLKSLRAAHPVLHTYPDDILSTLIERHAEPHRHYHTLKHVLALLRHLEQQRHLATATETLTAAILFHDAVYDTRRQDNETRSAELAGVQLSAIGWSPSTVERVQQLVLATHHHQAPPDDHDAWLFLDLDLSILSAEPATYDRYAQDIRREYAWVPEADYHQGRARVLKAFLSRDHVYRTPTLAARWEPLARANIARELAQLG